MAPRRSTHTLGMPKPGTKQPYRPRPRDFRVMFVALGWEGVGHHYRAHWQAVRRWIDEEGRGQLKAERWAVVVARRRAEAQARKRARGRAQRRV